MKLSIQKWGNSASVRLPAALLEQIGASIGTGLEVSITKEGLLLKPERRPHYSLDALLAEMPGDSLPQVADWENLSPLGQEAL